MFLKEKGKGTNEINLSGLQEQATSRHEEFLGLAAYRCDLRGVLGLRKPSGGHQKSHG